MNAEAAAATTLSEYEAKIAALKRKVGQRTWSLTCKNATVATENSNELLSIVSGPLPAGSNGGVRRSNAHGALFHCTQPQAPRLSDQQMLKSEPPGQPTPPLRAA